MAGTTTVDREAAEMTPVSKSFLAQRPARKRLAAGLHGFWRFPAALLLLLLTVACHRDTTPAAAEAAPAPAAVEVLPDELEKAQSDEPEETPSGPGTGKRPPDNIAPVAGSLMLPASQYVMAADGRARLRFDRVVNDGRCPSGVQCVWAGEVRAAFTLDTNGQQQSFELSYASEPKAERLGHAVEFLAYGLCPADHGLAAGSECVQVRVAALASIDANVD